jgi:hypothetical protein
MTRFSMTYNALNTVHSLVKNIHGYMEENEFNKANETICFEPLIRCKKIVKKKLAIV